jgi:hypothetical protein
VAVTLEVRGVNLRPKPTIGTGPQSATVTFSIKADSEPNFDISFTVPADRGLDVAIDDAKAALGLFSNDLSAAARSFTFPQAPRRE